MSFDFEGYAYELLSIREIELLKSRKMFLEGFDKIINRSVLDMSRLEDALDTIAGSRKEFTPLVPIDFTKRHKDDITKGMLISKFIPINDYFHLSFWVWRYNEKKNSNNCAIYYRRANFDSSKSEVDNSESEMNKKYSSRNSSRNSISDMFYRINNPVVPFIDIRFSGTYPDDIPLVVEFNGVTYGVANAFNNIIDPNILIESYSKMNYVIQKSRISSKF